MTAIVGRYALQKRLLPGTTTRSPGPAATPPRRTTATSLTGSELLGERNQWYMERAVEEHERVHATRLAPVLAGRRAEARERAGGDRIPDGHPRTLDAQTAEAALRADPAFETALVDALKHWRFDVIDAAVLDDVPKGRPRRPSTSSSIR